MLSVRAFARVNCAGRSTVLFVHGVNLVLPLLMGSSWFITCTACHQCVVPSQNVSEVSQLCSVPGIVDMFWECAMVGFSA